MAPSEASTTRSTRWCGGRWEPAPAANRSPRRTEAAMRVRSVAAVIVFAAVGCGGRTATLTGKVTYQGNPVVSGSVIVLGADGTARSGVIQPDGTYAVEGVPRGPVRIGVLSPDP